MVLRPEQFTEQAHWVIQYSQELVKQYHHSQWDVEHVLLALLNQSQGGNYILERWQRHGRCKHQCVGSGL